MPQQLKSNEFYTGETLIFSAEVRRKSDNGLFDPISVKITISSARLKASDKVVIKIDGQPMTKSSVGIYSYDWNSDQTGSYNVTYTALDGTRVTIMKDTFKIV
jgi:hypothetical protein